MNATLFKLDQKPNYRSPLLSGLLIILLFFGGLGVWSVKAKLDSAAIAMGQITVESHRKTVQHLEGGIVKQLFVRDGDVVKAGDPLVKIDDTQSQAKLTELKAEQRALLATIARLIAERDQQPEITFPATLLSDGHNPSVQMLLNDEKSLFRTHQRDFRSTQEILQQRIAQLESEWRSLNSQLTALKKQHTLIKHEIAVTAPLVKKKFVAEKQLWVLRREAARLLGEHDQRLGQMAKIKQAIGETRLQIVNYQERQQKTILTELTQAQTKLAIISEKITRAQDQLQRTLITAPKAGTIVNLGMHTIGGVIKPAQPILDIVPKDDALIIEAKINPTDIDSVTPGLQTKVQLLAYNLRNTPLLAGTLTHVSADIINDPTTGQAYYKAQVNIAQKQLAALDTIILTPGMPVQVMIITEQTTLADYLITPLVNSLQRAFREQ